METTILITIIAIGTFLSIEIIILHNKYNNMATKQERMDAALATLQAGFVEIADDINALILAESDNISEDSLATLEAVAAKATELGNVYEKPEEPEQPEETA